MMETYSQKIYIDKRSYFVIVYLYGDCRCADCRGSIYIIPVQQRWRRQETQGGHLTLVNEELGDDVDHEHTQEVERLDARYAAST